jgi:hypothetical protein
MKKKSITSKGLLDRIVPIRNLSVLEQIMIGEINESNYHII